jgi:hypothetical protein
MLSISAVLLGPVTGGAGLYRLFGWSRGFILGVSFGLVTGAWVGWSVAKHIKHAAAKVRKSFDIVLRVSAAVLMLLASCLPLALFEDSLGGGSGYGEGLPRVASRFFEHQIEPWFNLGLRWVSFGAKLWRWGSQILSGIFWVLVICCLFDAARRFLEVSRRHDRKMLTRFAASGTVLVTGTLVLFFSLSEGKARPHSETICSSMTESEFWWSATNGSKSESYPVSALQSERETMSKYFEEWQPSPIKDDPPFRVTSISPDGTTEIELMNSGAKVKSRPGRSFACREYGPEGLWLGGGILRKINSPLSSVDLQR